MTGKTLKTCALGVAVIGSTALTSLNTQAAITFDTRALSGDHAPGTEPWVRFFTFTAPVLNATGQIAFHGFLTGTTLGSPLPQGVWSEGEGSLNLVAQAGKAAPGAGAGVVYNGFDFASLLFNAAGQTAFSATLTGPGVEPFINDRGIWSEGSGSLGLVARTSDAAPGTDLGVKYGHFEGLKFNEAGQTAFKGFLAGPGVDDSNNTGIWSEDSGALRMVVQEGDAAPGTQGVFDSFTVPAFNGAGQTAFLGSFTGPDGEFTNERGIWSEGSGSLALVARTGDAMPGTKTGVFRDFTSLPALNGSGQVAFTASFFDFSPSADSTINSGLWSEGSGSLELVARTGDAAPGTEPDVVFSAFGSPGLNETGQTTFSGVLTGPGVDHTNDRGVWSKSSDSLELIMRTGDTAPGAGSGVVFSRFSRFLLNGSGRIVFEGFLAGADVDSTNNAGLWAIDPNGVLTLIARTGDLFDINDDPLIDDFRTIRSFRLATNSDGENGLLTIFNDADQLAFKLAFTDGSEGVFVATVPEPATLVMFVGVFGTLASRRR